LASACHCRARDAAAYGRASSVETGRRAVASRIVRMRRLFVYARAMARKKKAHGRSKKRKLFGAALAAYQKKRGGKKHRRARKSTSLTRSAPHASVVGMAKRSRRRRSHSLARRSSAPKRGRLRAIGGLASEQKHMTGAILAAAALGFAKKQGYTIPHVEAAGEAGTLALAGYALAKFKIYDARWLRHAVTGLAAIAVYDAVSTGNIPLLSSSTAAKAKTTTSGAYDAGYET
jgi:hypothetical protein